MIQTLIELPKIGAPTKSLQQPSTDMLALQARTLGLSSTRVASTIHYGIPKLDEEIQITYYDSSTLIEEKMNEIQSALDKRRRHEAMRKEYKYKQAMNEIKDIFMDAFSLQPSYAKRKILEKLLDIVDQINNEDHDTSAKIMEWSKKKFQVKVNQKISNDIILGQVDLAKKLERIKVLLGNIFSLYTKLYDFSNFKQETSQTILSLARNLKISSMQLPTNPSQSEKHFAQTLHTRQELAILIVEETTIKAKLMQI